MKNLHSANLKQKSKYCNANILQLINFSNWRISNLQLATLSLPYLTFAKTNQTICHCRFHFPVYLARFSPCNQIFQQEKKVCINHWNLMNERQPFKNVFCKNRYSSK